MKLQKPWLVRGLRTEQPMLGDYVFHYPITDFSVALLVIAALFQITCLVLKRPQWQVIADATLVVGFLGSLAAVGTGMWLVAVSDHGRSKDWFAYSGLGVAAIATLALAMSKRRPGLAKLKIIALVIAAGLVSTAGFFGGKMAHPANEQGPHTHGDDGTQMQPNESVSHEHGTGEHGMTDKPTPTTGSADAHSDHQHSTGVGRAGQLGRAQADDSARRRTHGAPALDGLGHTG